MKKKILIGLMILGLSSCTMHEDKYTGQEIFYSQEPLAESRELPKYKRINSSFTYRKGDDIENCNNCPILN